MKTTLVRAAVLSLALVGFGAASFVNKVDAEKKVIVTVSQVPIHACGPNNGCGLD